MKEEVLKIYTCEFCGRYYKRKHFAVRHELYCGKNPNNKHICLSDCINLKKETEDIDNYYGVLMGKRVVFICKKSGERMYSYVAERMNLSRNPDCDLGVRMPIKCDNYLHECAHLGSSVADCFI